MRSHEHRQKTEEGQEVSPRAPLFRVREMVRGQQNTEKWPVQWETSKRGKVSGRKKPSSVSNALRSK